MSATRKCRRRTSRASRVISADLGLARLPVVLGEQVGDLVLRLVDHRRDDVRGRLVGELQDVLAEVGLDRLDAGGASASLSPASSESIDFDLMAFFTPWRRQISSTSSQASSPVSAKSTVAPRRVASRSKRSM